ncbi:TPA: 1,4-dihydroxy-2-naphthoate octaprenyltransferase [Haemophilus influenzae]|uniref:1,4-dihydroxy-2-naphthoate octaprenyltransferase n=1 Tax=Haemophilus influenzae TaxID=727 RepID=A0A158SZ47_HAEIF|nr:MULTISPECIES: 1,4-dihydroxy-2-naphthoate octaprenyltransferase [Haemophilus]EDK09340.1 1,4-dihydroxy-2-naphthoate octaprenyltransferase [Haemophilus influenzae PittHH]ADO95539.1 1,4-dihydroxy-2-naphthoate octaprenyltransferase [Haemophilus influenzae R2846]AVJ02892.1 1,4-dihydroxy-2-naphthoate octaprenyltransferase [Haemophilus influenzae]AVJ04438.1 1,4-dihydroxy-2-naphthoate octaprenyltransferase [Haemophilus influenzae]AYO33933.1 1,4-dihydroxy-2-naphthoate octaprenyltransferase [Haemophil
MTNEKLKMWWETARPKTLPLALASIFTGSALGYWANPQGFNGLVMALCLLTTILLQVLSNFANDYGDHQKGSDTEERIGPLRGIQKGAISAKELKWGLILMVMASFLSGSFLIGIAYENLSDLFAFAGLGILAIVAAITYTVGVKPYGYMGLGDISVLVFFGLLGVGGTYYLQTHSIASHIILPAIGSGLLASAVLNINNLRDIEQDAKASKNTLAVRLGAYKGRVYHCILLSVAALCYLAFAVATAISWTNYLFVLAMPLLAKHAIFVYRSQQPSELRPMLAQMSMISLLINILFSLGLLIG